VHVISGPAQQGHNTEVYKIPQGGGEGYNQGAAGNSVLSPVRGTKSYQGLVKQENFRPRTATGEVAWVITQLLRTATMMSEGGTRKSKKKTVK